MELPKGFEEDSVGTYRCHDPSANLNIKFVISNAGSADQWTENIILQWQQKLFSPPELESYGTLEKPETELQQRFKEEAARQSASGPAARLVAVFTRVHAEQFTAEYERSRSLLSPAPDLPKASQALMGLRYRGTASGGSEPTTDPVSEYATVTSQEQRLRRVARLESMFVMLYVEQSEHLLCRLDWSPSGQLTVRPDFSRSALPYRLQVGEGQRGLYAYRLEWVDAADDSRPPPAGHRSLVASAGAQRREAPPRPGPATEMSLPPAGTLLVALSGELVSARGFQHDNLYIHYFMELPKGWRASSDAKMWGITQLSRAAADGDAHFGFPVSAELMWGPSDDDVGELGSVAAALPADGWHRWPTLYLEVLSEDAMGVCRTEGYCHVSVSATAGPFAGRLQAWRPTGDRHAQLRRHFIGGSPELEDPSFVAVPTGLQGDRLSRYGFRTETTGEVCVRLWTLQRSQRLLGVDGSLQPTDQQTSVGTVLEAFRRARLRMLRARQGLDAGSLAPDSSANRTVESVRSEA